MGEPLGPTIGIDLGGTKIEGVALLGSREVVARRRVATPRDDYEGTLAAIVALVAGIERELGRRVPVGVGMPGTISPATGLVKNANSAWLNSRPLDRDLRELLGRDVRFANDANCFALSEAADGAAAGAEAVFGVILGTGVGGGLVVAGRTIGGANGVAGEWGHNPLPWPDDSERPGPSCYCGRSGCIETFLSGPGLAADLRAVTGVHLTGPEIVDRALAGDVACTAALDRYVDRLARGLAAVINVFDPDVIVLGGGISGIERLYRDVPQRWGRWVFSDHVATRLVPPVHGDASGVRGAARLTDQSAAPQA